MGELKKRTVLVSRARYEPSMALNMCFLIIERKNRANQKIEKGPQELGLRLLEGPY